MAALCSDHESVQPWGLVTTSPDDYRTDLTTPFQPTSDKSSWDPTASYAQLLYQALKNAPGKTMKLCEIYHWFRSNIKKPDIGWENSIRYNLSMNKAFEMVEQKRTGRWRLTEAAIREGVQATSRYRNRPTPNKRKPCNPKRQASGAKGGRASARGKESRLELLACELPPHHTPNVNVGCSTTPETGALGSLLPACPHTDFDADALFCTDQAYLYDQIVPFYQPGTLLHQWGWPGDAEMGFAAYNGLLAQLNYQGLEGVTVPY